MLVTCVEDVHPMALERVGPLQHYNGLEGRLLLAVTFRHIVDRKLTSWLSSADTRQLLGPLWMCVSLTDLEFGEATGIRILRKPQVKNPSMSTCASVVQCGCKCFVYCDKYFYNRYKNFYHKLLAVMVVNGAETNSKSCSLLLAHFGDKPVINVTC